MKKEIFLFCIVSQFFWMHHASSGNLQVQALLRDMVVVQLDGKRITLFKGRAAVSGLQLISSDSYEAVIEYQGKRKKYYLGNQPVRTHYPATTSTAKHQVWPDRHGMYFTAGSINGVGTSLLLDTGASVVAMNIYHARSFGIDLSHSYRRLNVKTASGQTTGYAVKLNTVRIGGIQLNNVDAVILQGSYPERVLLGMSFLKNVEMQRKNKMITLTAKPY